MAEFDSKCPASLRNQSQVQDQGEHWFTLANWEATPTLSRQINVVALGEKSADHQRFVIIIIAHHHHACTKFHDKTSNSYWDSSLWTRTGPTDWRHLSQSRVAHVAGNSCSVSLCSPRCRTVISVILHFVLQRSCTHTGTHKNILIHMPTHKLYRNTVSLSPWQLSWVQRCCECVRCLCEMIHSPLSSCFCLSVLFSSEPPVQIDRFIEPRLLVLINFGGVFVLIKASFFSTLNSLCVCVCPAGWDLGVMQALFIPIQQIKAVWR